MIIVLKPTVPKIRRCIGYEIQEAYRKVMEAKLGLLLERVSFQTRPAAKRPPTPRYTPAIADITPLQVTTPESPAPLVRVKAVTGPDTLLLADGRRVRLRGLVVPEDVAGRARDYLGEYLQGSSVY